LSEANTARAIFGRPQSRCFVCGRDNADGLHLEFHTDADGSVHAEWEAAAALEGYNGVLHGGIICTLLDEAMAKAVIAQQWRAMTVEINVRYRRHVSTGEQLVIRGRIIERKKRRIQTEATMSTAGGEERARATGTFLSVE